MQFVADVLDVPVERPLGSEAVSLGAAYVAGLAVGYWSDVEVLRANWHRAAAWEPAMDPRSAGTSTPTGDARCSAVTGGCRPESGPSVRPACRYGAAVDTSRCRGGFA